MSLFYNTNNYEIQEIDDNLIEQWRLSNNPKYIYYQPVPTKPSPYATWGQGVWIPPSLEDLKNIKFRQLDDEWNMIITSGWPTPYGWKLGLTSNDISLLTGNFILAKEAYSMGLGDSFVVVDTDGMAHELNLADLTALMLQYGQTRALLSTQYANTRLIIKNCTTIEELNNINV